MKETYTQRLQRHLGPREEGEMRIFGLGSKDLISAIKTNLKNSFCCTLWTYEHPIEQIKEEDILLTKEGIVHCYDEVLDAFLCFNSKEDMIGFYEKLKKDFKK